MEGTNNTQLPGINHAQIDKEKQLRLKQTLRELKIIKTKEEAPRNQQFQPTFTNKLPSREELFQILKNLKYLKVLQDQKYFNNTDEEIEKLMSYLELIICKEGQFIFHHGEKANYFYILIDGSVNILIPKTQEQITHEQDLIYQQRKCHEQLKYSFDEIEKQFWQNEIEKILLEQKKNQQESDLLILKNQGQQKYYTEFENKKIFLFENIMNFKSGECFGEVSFIVDQKRLILTNSLLNSYRQCSALSSQETILGRIAKEDYYEIFSDKRDKLLFAYDAFKNLFGKSNDDIYAQMALQMHLESYTLGQKIFEEESLNDGLNMKHQFLQDFIQFVREKFNLCKNRVVFNSKILEKQSKLALLVKVKFLVLKKFIYQSPVEYIQQFVYQMKLQFIFITVINIYYLLNKKSILNQFTVKKFQINLKQLVANKITGFKQELTQTSKYKHRRQHKIINMKQKIIQNSKILKKALSKQVFNDLIVKLDVKKEQNFDTIDELNEFQPMRREQEIKSIIGYNYRLQKKKLKKVPKHSLLCLGMKDFSQAKKIYILTNKIEDKKPKLPKFSLCRNDLIVETCNFSQKILKNSLNATTSQFSQMQQQNESHDKKKCNLNSNKLSRLPTFFETFLY